MKGKRIYSQGLGVLILVAIVKADAADVNSSLLQQLTNTLNEFAQKHQLSGTQMENLMGELVLHERKLKKGGVGVIDKETFLVLNEKQNTLIVGGQKWRGRNSDGAEVVLISEDKVFPLPHSVDTARLKLIVFSPADVRYIDVSNNRGGVYLR